MIIFVPELDLGTHSRSLEISLASVADPHSLALEPEDVERESPELFQALEAALKGEVSRLINDEARAAWAYLSQEHDRQQVAWSGHTVTWRSQSLSIVQSSA